MSNARTKSSTSNTPDKNTSGKTQTSGQRWWAKLSDEERAAYREAKEKELGDLHAKLETGLAQVGANRDEFAKLLRGYIRFHNYSPTNTFLIALQKPDAQLPASETDWKKRGFIPKSDAQKILILRPNMKEVWFDRFDARRTDIERQHKTPAKRAELRQAGYRSELKMFGTKVVHVIDATEIVNSATGEPLDLARIPKPRLLAGEGNAAIEYMALNAAASLGYRIIEENLAMRGLNGYSTGPDEGLIVLQKGLAPAQRQKTLLHELSHVAIGHAQDMSEYQLHRDRMEAEAEGLAFVLGGMCGLDTSEFSLPYIDVWARGDTKVIAAALKTIHDTMNKVFLSYFALDPADPAYKLSNDFKHGVAKTSTSHEKTSAAPDSNQRQLSIDVVTVSGAAGCLSLGGTQASDGIGKLLRPCGWWWNKKLGLWVSPKMSDGCIDVENLTKVENVLREAGFAAKRSDGVVGRLDSQESSKPKPDQSIAEAASAAGCEPDKGSTISTRQPASEPLQLTLL